MLDSTGKKIELDDQNVDFEFALKEINFFTKGFQRENNDVTALGLAKCVHQFLKSNGDAKKVESVISLLEDYSANTKNDTFVWNLVYIRRLQGEYFSKNFQKKEMAKCRRVSAKHFEKICEIKPTLYNKCCRVLEYVTASIEYTEVNMRIERDAVLERAEELFLEIPPVSNEDYYLAGRYLYYNIYLKNKDIYGIPAKALESIKNAVDYALKMYLVNDSTTNLRRLCDFYTVYSETKGYSVNNAEEEERLKHLIECIASKLGSGHFFKRKFEEFKKLLNSNNQQDN